MPVNILLCEGADRSPDKRILNKLLEAARCGEIKASGGKSGMETKIRAWREARGVKNTSSSPDDIVFGLLDGDFINDWKTPKNEPSPWLSRDKKTRFGWRWERKEIENYLIDPVVVAKALESDPPSPKEYKKALEDARDKIAIYQAARTSLSASRTDFRNLSLPSFFGKNKNIVKAIPDKFDEKTCREGIKETVSKYNEDRPIDVEKTLSQFSSLIPEFAPSAPRHTHYLHAFSGKDLLSIMNDSLKTLGFPGAAAFQEKILVALEETTDDIADWLPEWKALREAIDSI